MIMDRRQLIVGGAAVVGALAVPSVVQAMPILQRPSVELESPLFVNVDPGHLGFLIRHYQPKGPPLFQSDKIDMPSTPFEEMAFKICKISRDKPRGMRLRSPTPENLERVCVSQNTNRIEPLDMIDLAHWTTDQSKFLAFNITRASNRVARATRRGIANTAFVHPEMDERLVGAFEYLSTISRTWGTSRTCALHKRDWMPKDRTFMFYSGSSRWDKPAMLFGVDDIMKYELFMPDDVNDYGCWVTI
jgi:hypothetical protein